MRRLTGSALTLAWVKEDGLLDPILIPNKEGLGLTVPPSSFSVRDVSNIIGNDIPINVIDVNSQDELPGWTLGEEPHFFHLVLNTQILVQTNRGGQGVSLITSKQPQHGEGSSTVEGR